MFSAKKLFGDEACALLSAKVFIPRDVDTKGGLCQSPPINHHANGAQSGWPLVGNRRMKQALSCFGPLSNSFAVFCVVWHEGKTRELLRPSSKLRMSWTIEPASRSVDACPPRRSQRAPGQNTSTMAIRSMK